jgi:2-haloacid dehalogenase
MSRAPDLIGDGGAITLRMRNGATMSEVESLKASVKICMFDQYGTVVDMHSGLTEVAAPFLKSNGWTGNANSFVTWWRRTHFENSMIDALLHKEHTSYREIGHRSVAYVLDRVGIPYTMDEIGYLVAQIEKLRPFPEVPAALARLQARYKLVVLSNGDPDMLESAKHYHGIPFNRVISVAEAGSFKPHVATYTTARGRDNAGTLCSDASATLQLSLSVHTRDNRVAYLARSQRGQG